MLVVYEEVIIVRFWNVRFNKGMKDEGRELKYDFVE